MEKEINWEERILSCNTALDLLKLEKEAIEQKVNLDDLYCEAWYNNINALLHREEEFDRLNDIEKRLGELEKQFIRHDHKDKEVLVRVS